MSRHAIRPAALAALLVAALSAAAGAQIVRATGLSPFVKDYRIDFAIPDAPAFKLLDVDQSAILRPQTPRDLALAFDGFRGANGTFVVPKQFGVEFSPGLFIGSGALTLGDYQARRALYATRFSAATNRDSLGRGQLAIGARFSIVDEQDIRARGGGGSDPEVTRLTAEVLDVYVGARKRVGPAAPIVLTDDEKGAVAALSDSIRHYWAEQYWNASSFEVALGGRTQTADSLGHDPKVDELAAWITYANGLRGWGQLLVGGKLGSARDSSGAFTASNALAVRLYIGSNALKAFAEAQQAISSKTDAQWLVNSGVELRVPSLGWIDASAGYAANPSGGKPRVISSFKFKTGVPGT